MARPSPQTPKFEPDGGAASGPGTRDQDPVLSSLGALVRFEFEAGRGNDGTKILMVEWEDDGEDEPQNAADWEVSWEGKTTVLCARDGAEGTLHRIYFLLGPGTSVPPVVKLAREGGAAREMKPLPAIFPAELGLRGTSAGKRGILHTRYAKQRLSALQKEIELEMRTNGEGIGLEIAMQEKQWLEETFGVGAKAPDHQHQMASPASPKTPGGGRLSERLKGLKLGTSASELASPSTGACLLVLPLSSTLNNQGLDPDSNPSSHPLSPDTGDLAVSSFALFHGNAPRRAVAQNPPSYVLGQQKDLRGGTRMSSLDEVAAGPVTKDDDETSELFAVKLSPRSPDMTKSPFSFASKDAVPGQK
jgi:hypothetical protein